MSRIHFGRRGPGHYGSDEDGSALIIALAVIMVLGLFAAALPSLTDVGISAHLSNRTQCSNVYTSEGGILGAATSIRSNTAAGRDDGSVCPTFSPTGGFANSLNPSVICQPMPGSGGGTNSSNTPTYGVLALPAVGSTTEGVVDDDTLGSGSGSSVIVEGGGVASNGTVQRTGNSNSGEFHVVGSIDANNCTGPKPNTITANGTGTHKVCNVSTTFSDPTYAQATTTAPPAAPAPVCLTSAAKFFPGTYTAAPTALACATKPMWFSPGNYYF